MDEVQFHLPDAKSQRVKQQALKRMAATNDWNICFSGQFGTKDVKDVPSLMSWLVDDFVPLASWQQ